MTVPNKLFLDRIDNHEKEVLRAFDSPDDAVRFFILEWHRRAHKTTLAINLLVRECCRYSQSKYVYIAPTQVWAREVVWDDPHMLWDALPDKNEMSWKANEQKMLIKFANGSMLKIGGSDKPDALRGIDADGVVPDEWSLHKQETWTQIFRPIIAGPRKPGNRDRWVMFLYTPKGQNHATDMFNVAANIESESQLPDSGQAENTKPGWFASRLSADKSGIILRSELDLMLTEVADGTLTQVEYDQEMLCKRITTEERTLITSAMLDNLDKVDWENHRCDAKEIRKIVSIDPAFMGDMCAMKAFENGRELDKRSLHFTMTSEIIQEAKLMAQQIDTKNFIVDCIGIGKGVADGLHDDAAGYDVQYFNSASRAGDLGSGIASEESNNIYSDLNLYANKKAEAVGYAAKLIRKLKIESVVDIETKRQLIALSRYKTSGRNGKTIMIPNDEVKKIIGCSPDDGLCWIYGQWGLQYVEPLRNDDLDRYDEAMKDHRDRRRARLRQSGNRRPMRMA